MMGDSDLSGRVGLETTDFKTAISEINREMRVVESAFRASAAALGDWAGDASGLESRIKTLNTEIDLQGQKVSALKGEYERVKDEQGENSKAAQDLEIRLNKETEQLNKMGVELQTTEGKLGEMGDESGDTAGEVDELKGKEEDAEKSTKDLGDAEEKAEGQTDKFGGALSALGAVAKVGIAALVGVATAAVGVVAGLAKMVLSAAEAAGELVDMSLKTGISVERLQELEYIGGQVGTSIETMTGSLAKMTRSMGDAADNAEGPAAKAFAALGVSVVDANGNLRDSEEVFGDVIDALGNVENATEADTLAMDIFGKSALELNPLIKTGSENLAAMADEAHAVGAVMDEGAVMGLEAFGDSLEGLKAGLKGMMGTMAAELLPVFQSFLDNINNFVQSEQFTQFISDLTEWLQTNLPVAIQYVSDFWTNVLQPAIEAVWEWLSTVLIPFLRDEIYPWLQENIPVAIQFLSDAWTTVLKPAIEAVWNWLSTVLIPFLGELIGWLATNVPIAIQALSDFWTLTLLPAITAVWEFLDKYIIPIIQGVIDIMGTLGTLAITALQGAWENVLLPAITTVYDFFNENILPILTDVADFLIETLSPGVEDFTGFIDTLADAIGNGLQNALKWVIDKLKDLQTWLESITLPDWLTPGSPTPFEMGLRGIAGAMGDLNNLTAKVGFVPSGLQGSGMGAGGSTTSISVPVTATVNNEIDMHKLAWMVADEIQRRR